MKNLLYNTEAADGYLEDGILKIKFKQKKFDLDTAKATVKTRLAASKGVSYPVIIDATEVQSITKEARDYFATEEGVSLITASALILNSVVGKFLGNFFLQINKPKTPVKLFNDEKEAEKWLQKYKHPK